MLVVGYGNRLRRDDGVGQEVADVLAGVLAENDATVLAVHQLLPELAEDVSRAETVIFIDATVGRPAGSVTVEVLAPGAAAGAPHELGPFEVLALARDLFGSCPRALLVGVGAADLGYGTGLSTTVTDAIPAVIEAVLAAAES